MKSTDFTDNTLNGYLTFNNGITSFSKTLFEDYSSEGFEKFTLKLRYEGPNSSVIPGGISSEVIVTDSSIPVYDTNATEFSSGGVFISTYRSGEVSFPTTLYFSGSGLSTTTIFTDNSLTGSFNFVDSGDGKTGIGTVIRTIDSGNLGIGSFSIIPEILSFDIRLGGIGGTVLANRQISIYQNPYNIGVNTTLFDTETTLNAQILGVGIGTSTLYYTITGISTSGFSDGLLSGSLVTNNAGLGTIQKIAVGYGFSGSFDIKISTGSTLGPVVAISTTINYDLISTAGGQASYTTPGTYSWVCPVGVTSVCVVCIGGGGGGIFYDSGTYSMAGGGGGGLGWKNNISVTEGQSYTVVVGSGGLAGDYSEDSTAGGDSYFIDTSTVSGSGGNPGRYATAISGGTYTGDGGGNGGGVLYFTSSDSGPQGGGGAGGYSGNGGSGGYNIGYTPVRPTAGAGGGGAGGGNNAPTDTKGYGGGGTGILGEGTSGTATGNGPGGGGSGGGDGYAGPGRQTSSNTAADPVDGTQPRTGGDYGGGGGGGTDDRGGNGGSGAVRIIWGPGRSFPSTSTDDVVNLRRTVEEVYGSADITKTSFPTTQSGFSSGNVDVLVAIAGTFSTSDTGTLIDLGGTGSGVSAGLYDGVLRGSAFSGDNITWGTDADSSKIEYDMSSILDGNTEVTIYLVANKLDKVLYAYLKNGNTIQSIVTGQQAATPPTNTFGSNGQGYGTVNGSSVANLGNNWEGTFNNPSNITSIKVWYTSVNLSNFPNTLF